jgi:predicted RNase H-related nuclease YkuK (DUF458 family)
MYFENLQIRSLSQDEISFEHFIEKIKQADKDGYKIFIGTDSQVLPTHVSFVTCVCAYLDGKGGFGFFVKEKDSKGIYPNMKMRLLHEVYRSIDTAITVQPHINSSITIHIDVGFDMKKSKSAKYNKEFMNLVLAQGYDCESKPNSWATTLADRFTKS